MPYSERRLKKNLALMSQGVEVPVELVTFEERRATGTVRLKLFDEAERGARARKFMFTCWAFCLVMWIMPPHVLWPVIMFVAGLVGYQLSKGQTRIVLGGRATCPRCGTLQLLRATTDEFPLLHFCTECRQRSSVRELKETATGV